MASIILECPHCGAEKIGFHVAFDSAATLPHGQSLTYKKYRSLLLCWGCEEGVVAVFDATAGRDQNFPNAAPQQAPKDPRQVGWHLVKTYPVPQPSKCPTHTPDRLKGLFLQAANALKRGDPDASGAMSRKVVDVSTQLLLGDQAQDYKTIFARIEAVAKKGMLTDDLKDWAHQVRLGGADAAHDLDPFTKEEAEELLDFAELYLTYVYTLPSRLKERRERAEKEKAAKGASKSSRPGPRKIE